MAWSFRTVFLWSLKVGLLSNREHQGLLSTYPFPRCWSNLMICFARWTSPIEREIIKISIDTSISYSSKFSFHNLSFFVLWSFSFCVKHASHKIVIKPQRHYPTTKVGTRLKSISNGFYTLSNSLATIV